MSAQRRSPTSVQLPPDDPGRRRLPPLLRAAWYSLNKTFGRRIASLEITPDQFTVMRWLLEAEAQGRTQRELAELMASDPNTIVGVINRMENLGLVMRRPHESDKRAYRIRLTARGKRTYLRAREIAVALQSEVLASLPAKKRDEFLAHLEQVATACREALSDS